MNNNINKDSEIKKKQMTTIIILIVLIVVVFIISFLFFMFSLLYKYQEVVVVISPNINSGLPSEPSSNPPALSINGTAGASTSGIFFYSGGDVCEPPFWGENCSLESYSPEYINMGEIDERLIESKNMGQRSLSFGQDSCTSLCDDMDNCKGVLWDEFQCKLVTSDIILSRQQLPIYEPLEQGNLYLKSIDSMKIAGVSYAYTSPIVPLRYWINQNNIIVLLPLKLTMSNKTIYGFVNNSDFVFAMSDEPFNNYKQAKVIIINDKNYTPNNYRWVMSVPRQLYEKS